MELKKYSKVELQSIYAKLTLSDVKLRGSKSNYIEQIYGYIKVMKSKKAFNELKESNIYGE